MQPKPRKSKDARTATKTEGAKPSKLGPTVSLAEVIAIHNEEIDPERAPAHRAVADQ